MPVLVEEQVCSSSVAFVPISACVEHLFRKTTWRLLRSIDALKSA